MRPPSGVLLLAFALAGCPRPAVEPCDSGPAEPCVCPPAERADAGALAAPTGAPIEADGSGTTRLPPPRQRGGMPLLEALAARRSTRSFDPRPLPASVLSELLWATAGVNRPEDGRRTAPSARNRQEIDLYVTTAAGAFVYRPAEHALVAVSGEDVRALTGMQDFVGLAPLNLVFVADLARMGEGSAEERAGTMGADAAFMAQNAYLYCASEGLAAVVRGRVDRAPLAAALRLREDQRIVYAQTVGYPAPAEGAEP